MNRRSMLSAAVAAVAAGVLVWMLVDGGRKPPTVLLSNPRPSTEAAAEAKATDYLAGAGRTDRSLGCVTRTAAQVVALQTANQAAGGGPRVGTFSSVPGATRLWVCDFDGSFGDGGAFPRARVVIFLDPVPSGVRVPEVSILLGPDARGSL